MFIGEYQHHLDDKDRLAVPTKFREQLSGGAVVTRGLDQCLFIYPMEEWNQLAEKLSKLPIAQSKSRAFARLMLAGAIDVQLDKQGRVVLPDYLKHYAKLKKKVVVAGLYNRLEVWDESAWETYKSNTEKNSGDIAEAMADLGV
ncbi:MAG: division/cell wall cluster transcriptional repressor MraZ [Patescibacteria group bacterium]